MEVSGAEDNLNYGGPHQEVSEENNNNKWPRDHSCDILVKNVIISSLSRKICLRLN